MEDKSRKVTLIHPKEPRSQMIAKKIGRNSLCQCGSGKKAKKCCGNTTKYYVKHV